MSVNEALPVKVTPFFQRKIDEEIAAIGRGGPLYRAVYPDERQFSFTTETTGDYINEARHQPVKDAPFIIRKYRDRAAFLVTEHCCAHCSYCFRSAKLLRDKQRAISVSEKVDALVEYLTRTPEIEEIIITGGDPLTINDDEMSMMLTRLSRWKLRVHTRAIVYAPELFTSARIALFKKHRVKLVFHIMHPYEICDVVARTIEELGAHAIALFAQYPLARGINDHYCVQKKLLTMLTELRVRPLSIFIIEPNIGAAPFRVPFARVEAIIDELQWSTPSWVNAVRVVLDTEIGKVRRENIVRREGGVIIFEREGRETRYTDIPADVPAGLNTLLWKDVQNLVPSAKRGAQAR